MSERDAFGREKGEDTLAEMGWSNAPPATPAPVKPTVAAEPPAKPAWTPPPPVRYHRRRHRVHGLFIPLFLIGVLALGIVGVTTVLQAGSDALDELEGAVRDAVPTTEGGTTGESLIRPAALKAALARLPDGDLEVLRVAPDRIDAQVIVRGKMHNVQVRADGEVLDVPTPATGRGERARVNVNAPSRIVRTATKRSGRRPGTVDYLVLLSISGKSEWQLFFDDGLHYSASASGKRVRRAAR